MDISIGIIGLPNVGKSTFFNLLTNKEVNIASYPFATVDPNVGVVGVPDERLDKLHSLYSGKKKINSAIEFYDIAGLVKNAHKGEGLGNQFLSHIQETNALVHIVRAFDDSNISHIEGESDPLRDIEIIENELILKDLEIAERNIEKISREAKSGSREKQKEMEALEEIKNVLNSGGTIHKSGLEKREKIKHLIKKFSFITAKPQIIIFNGSQELVRQKALEKVEELGFGYITVDLALESSFDSIIKKSYEILDLITFFTIGEDEVRAWPAKKGATAPEAAEIVHTDFKEKFIRAEVINWDDLVKVGSWSSARDKGLIATKGKDYTVQDGDILYIKI